MPALFGREHQLALLDSDLEPILLLPPFFSNCTNLHVWLVIAALTDVSVLEMLKMV